MSSSHRFEVTKNYSTMASLFQNIKQAQHYAAARPTYPEALFRLIASSCAQTANAVDIGCGTGQATVALAANFSRVLGIDPSPAQLSHALKHESVTYQTGTAIEALKTLPNQSVDCITAAQSIHWVDDLPAFYEQVNRVLEPNGVLAIWVYGNLRCEHDATLEHMIIHDLYETRLGTKYWDPRRRMVEFLYSKMPTMDEFYKETVATKVYKEGGELDIVKDLKPAELLGYLRSWSGYNNYCQKNPEASDPLQELEDYLNGSKEETIRVTWPLRLFLSVKK